MNDANAIAVAIRALVNPTLADVLIIQNAVNTMLATVAGEAPQDMAAMGRSGAFANDIPGLLGAASRQRLPTRATALRNAHPSATFHVGQRVGFGRPRGEQHFGVVVKLNEKSIKVKGDDGRNWKVSPSLAYAEA